MSKKSTIRAKRSKKKELPETFPFIEDYDIKPCEPKPTPEDDVKALKKKLRSIVAKKPVLPYPEEVKLQGWVKELEAALR